MSYAHDVKMELCEKVPQEKSGLRAQAYGLLLFGRRFGPKGIILGTEHARVASCCASLLEALFSVRPVERIRTRTDGRTYIEISVHPPARALEIFEAFGYTVNTVSLRVNRANLETEESVRDFLRGAFLSCGSVVNPDKDYHLEFVTPHLNLGKDLTCLLTEYGFEPKNIWRGGKLIVYFKDSGQIEDILTFMGAVRQSLELMNIKVYKDLRNKVNRVTNCETANIDKTVNAAAEQVAAIRKLMETHCYEQLPEELRETARLRLAHPDMSLRELGALLEHPLSRSGINHRLRRIVEFAKNL
ncbi:MAG: DNA-binding protein WhiA [Ethanoligenens sp.]|uniref:DNA-binding protein WhiA n=1 Tax=Ethanoligenens sp. TaxID=2099655 RepID=UPI0039ED9229